VEAITEEEMLTIEQAAVAASISARHMRRLVGAGLVPAWRPSPQIIRIPKSELLKVMRQDAEAPLDQ
jgi:excisionase family DNA binding protein